MSNDVCSSCGQPVQRTPSSRPEIICRECRWERRIVRKAKQQARKLSPSDAGRRAARARWANTQRPADDSGLRPHGTKAALSRHYSRGEKPCDVCRQAENERHRGRAPYGTKAGTCSQCGKAVWRGHTSRDEIICRDCRRRATPATMVCALADCGKEFEPKPKSRRRSQLGRTIYCSKSCANKASRRAPEFRTCEICGKTFTARGRKLSRTCSRECGWIVRLGYRPVKAEVTAKEITKIADRDRWVCGICKRRVSKTKRWPHPRSVTVDHILPRSQGGSNHPWNLRCAHLDCNARRGNRGGGEQLSLTANAELPPRWRGPARCRTCGERTRSGACKLHMPVWYITCQACGALATARTKTKRFCAEPGCKQVRHYASHDRKVSERPAHKRAMQAHVLHKQGMTWDEVADRLGYSASNVAAAAAARATGKRSRRKTSEYARVPRAGKDPVDTAA